MKKLFPILLLLGLTACTTKRENIPVWLLAPQEIYPQQQYLSAIGEGDTRRAAENSATAGLARIFQSDIQSTEALSETVTESRGKTESFDTFSEMNSDIQIRAEQKLLNVQFSEIFKDSRGRVHVTAFIPRAETAEIYSATILENARNISYLIRLAESSADPLRAYGFFRTASRKALENDILIGQLRIIHPQARERLALSYDPQTLYTQTARAATGVSFSIHMDNQAAADAIAAALHKFGFAKNSKEPVLSVSGSSSFEKTDLKRGALVFMRWRIKAEISDISGNPFLFLDHGSREGHITFDEARVRAERAMAVETEKMLKSELNRYFDRMVEADRH